MFGANHHHRFIAWLTLRSPVSRSGVVWRVWECERLRCALHVHSTGDLLKRQRPCRTCDTKTDGCA